MLLKCNLIKSVILLVYILYCLRKYTSSGYAYFVVLGGMIFKSTPFSPQASSSSLLVHPYVQTRNHKVLVTLSTNVDSKWKCEWEEGERAREDFFSVRTLAKILLDNFTSVIAVAFSTDIIECAVMTCDHLAFLHCVF